MPLLVLTDEKEGLLVLTGLLIHMMQIDYLLEGGGGESTGTGTRVERSIPPHHGSSGSSPELRWGRTGYY